MGVQLFKDGQSKVFNEYTFTDMLNAGWSLTEGGEASLQEVIDAIGCLDKDNPEHWTTTGRPRASAIKSLLEKPIDPSIIDEAIKAMK